MIPIKLLIYCIIATTAGVLIIIWFGWKIWIVVTLSELALLTYLEKEDKLCA